MSARQLAVARRRARRGSRAARAGSTAGRAARRPPPRSRSACVSPVASSRIAVLGDVQPAAHRRLAQRHVVRLGAGEVLQQVAELVGLDDAQVDRHPGVGARARGVLARRCGALDDVERRRSAASSAGGSEAVAMMSRSLTESARRRAEPASSTRSEAGCARSDVDDPLADLQRLAEQHPRARRLADAGVERLEHAPPRTSAPKPRTSRSFCASAAARSSRASRCRARRRACGRAWARARAGA